MRSRFIALSILLATLLPASGAFAKTIRVPQDMSLQNALNQAKHGDVVLIAAGTYTPPANGFSVRNLNRSFRVVAEDFDNVLIDGGGAGPLLEVDGGGAPGTVSFTGIRFENGVSDDPKESGGMTIDGANVKLTSCRFEGNRSETTTSGGGALQVRDGSRVELLLVTFKDNTSMHDGGAVWILDSEVRMLASTFESNNNLAPGHTHDGTGGAVFVLNSLVEVAKSRFKENATGFVGGAIRVFGSFDTGGSTLRVESSKFEGNSALFDPGQPARQPEAGGAIYAEDQSRVEIRSSEFFANQSYWGSAIAGYRSDVEVTDTRFLDNGPPDPVPPAFRLLPGKLAGVPTAGGTIDLVSNDQNPSDPLNRRSAALVVRDSIFRRTAQATTSNTQQGGCLFVGGDRNRLEGLGGVDQDGDAEKNRAQVTLENVVFSNCDAETTGPDDPGLGGAIFINLVDLTVTSSIFEGCDALGDEAVGGAIRSLNDNVVRISDSTFAGNSAEDSGGAILVDSGRVEISGTQFIGNDVSPGTNPPVETVANSPGSALTLRPAGGRDITGFVTDSTFTGNTGLAIVDVDALDPPFNLVKYSGNRIHNIHFGDTVYKNRAVGFSGLSAVGLNNLVIARNNGSSTDKSDGGNTRLTSAPCIGRLVAAPDALVTSGPVGQEGASPAYLGYAFAGAATARVGATMVQPSGGVLEVTSDGARDLVACSQTVASDSVDEDDGCPDTALCLDEGRFLVTATWRDFKDKIGGGFAVPFGSADSGLFYFFDEDNWEMLVKTLRGCGLNDRYWLFAAATTNVEYDIVLIDTLSGAAKSYFNPLGNPSPAITDTDALAACDVTSLRTEEPAWATEEPAWSAVGWSEAEPKAGNCTESETALCLNQERFQVEVTWKDFKGNTGSGTMVEIPFEVDDSGLFYFFNEDNWEMLVKILRGCNLNDHYWVFAAATTNVEYTLKVTDTETHQVKQYKNPLGVSAAAITDTGAFATCP